MIISTVEGGTMSYLVEKATIILMVVEVVTHYRVMKDVISITSIPLMVILMTRSLIVMVKDNLLLMANPCLATSLILKRG